jgi:preprotein translocase subunit SecF
MSSEVEGLNVKLDVPVGTSSQWLIRSAQGNPQLGNDPYLVHCLDPNSPEIAIATVRDAMSNMGQTAAVQSLGQPQDRHFMIRVEDKEPEGEGDSTGKTSAEKITNILEESFGSGEVVVLRSDYVGSRFSKDLTDQAGLLMGLTLLVILVYASIRFKPQYAMGAVIGIIHDSLIIVAFVVWTGMEFNTSTIAAILTILGYSINNTIVIFDRIRENRRIYPNDVFTSVLNRSLTETLSRSVITTLTTMLAVLSLIIFTTGSMRDFALALQAGMLSGVYTSMFIAPNFVNFWETRKAKKEKQRLAAA